ncbi:MAG: phage antirepressor KilAC domain-containing protein [Oscillospiraceae bacterium]|jgi:prophage antirepressor-like protein|nr:phage antirepressor KilAC domain-containing protein [Oscillospiraceae bacterium]
MKTQIQQFHNNEFGSIEILMIGDKLYFPATDCAEKLGYSKPHNAVSRHCHDSLKRGVIDSLGRTQEKIFIPEGDLYRLIIRSKLPTAERFEHWVFDEVLPCIRKHGAYIISEILEEAARNQKIAIDLTAKLQSEREKTAALKEYTKSIAPKARYCDQILQSKNAVPVSVIAKDYGMGAAAFNKLLHHLRIQYKTGDAWLLYQTYAKKGYTKSRTYMIGDVLSVTHTYWTQKGRRFLYDFLKNCGILPLAERPAA